MLDLSLHLSYNNTARPNSMPTARYSNPLGLRLKNVILCIAFCYLMGLCVRFEGYFQQALNFTACIKTCACSASVDAFAGVLPL